MDLAKLKTEISKPRYNGLRDEEIAALLSRPSETVDRETLSGGELLGIIASVMSRADLAGLSAGDRTYLQFLGQTSFLRFTPTLKAELQAIFGSIPAVRQAIVAYMKRTGTEAEELGLGRVPTPSEVAEARRL